jgi:hypothetical protein
VEKEAIKAHSIPLKDIKASEVLKHNQKIEKQLSKVQEAIQNLEAICKDGWLLKGNGLFTQRSETFYYQELGNF